jgi:hypothetical protein
MNTYSITPYSTQPDFSIFADIEDALRHAMLSYSVQHHLLSIGIVSEEDIEEALAKAMRICSLAGIDSSYHFKQIFVFDEKTGALHSEWQLSKTGLKLLITQSPSLNEKMACWLWEMVDG